MPVWGSWKLPGSSPISSAKHKKGPDTPRAGVSGRTPHSSLICPFGAQGCSRKESLASGSLSRDCTPVGTAPPLPHCSGFSLPGRAQGCCQTTTGSCARTVLFMGPLASEAARGPVVCECSRSHIRALISEGEKGRSLGPTQRGAAAAASHCQ